MPAFFFIPAHSPRTIGSANLPAMIIRRAMAADAPALTALMHASSAYSGEWSRILAGYEITPSQLARDHLYVAEDSAGSPLGFYSLTVAGEPELDLLFVADTAQGTGLGRRLFDHMRALAGDLGLESVLIVSHPPSEGFYRRMGAERTGTRAPTVRAPWERPVLTLTIKAARQ